MKSKVFQSFKEVVEDIPTNSTIMLPGFAGPGTPRNLLAALLEHGVKGLTGISNGSGGRDDSMDVSVLINAGQFKKMIMAFTASPHPSNVTIFDELYQAGKIEAELVPQGTLAERIRAGGAGVAAFYTPTGVGTLLAEGKETRTIDGKEYVLEHALTADYCLIRGHKADTLGNVIYKGTSRNFNPIMATSANITIVEVDEIVEPGVLGPEEIVTPGVYIDRIVLRPADFSPYD